MLVSERVMTCILCPNGCDLEVRWDGKPTEDSVAVSGNLCPKGVQYALDELTHPERTLTTSVRVRCGAQRLTSVKTATAVPREALASVHQALLSVVLDAPVEVGQVVAENVAGTGVNVLVTRPVPRRSSDASQAASDRS